MKAEWKPYKDALTDLNNMAKNAATRVNTTVDKVLRARAEPDVVAPAGKKRKLGPQKELPSSTRQVPGGPSVWDVMPGVCKQVKSVTLTAAFIVSPVSSKSLLNIPPNPLPSPLLNC